MNINDTTNAAGEYDPPASAAAIYAGLDAWEGAQHEHRSDAGGRNRVIA